MRRSMILLTPLLLLGMHRSSLAQVHVSNLTRVDEAVESQINEVTPEWESHSVQPASVDGLIPNDKVRIRQWTSKGRNVRVAIVQHQSEEEATSALRQFAVDKKTNSRLLGFGDEAYVWGIRGSIAFRRGNLTVYVTSVLIMEVDAAEASKDIDEARQKTERSERDEEAVVTRGFAQKVA